MATVVNLPPSHGFVDLGLLLPKHGGHRLTEIPHPYICRPLLKVWRGLFSKKKKEIKPLALVMTAGVLARRLLLAKRWDMPGSSVAVTPVAAMEQSRESHQSRNAICFKGGRGWGSMVESRHKRSKWRKFIAGFSSLFAILGLSSRIRQAKQLPHCLS